MMRIGLDKSGQKSDIYHTARQERRKPKGEIQMKNKKYYIAYGSNLSVEQMADRCPDAKIAGQAVLAGWELLFRGCATIAPNPKKNTPVLVWEISERDEENLDLYEGYPNYYRKEDLNIELLREGAEPEMVTAMVYIMENDFGHRAPSRYYYSWSGSSWDGKSVYTKKTQEQNTDGSYVTITADFRKYACVEDSIADHAAYLLGAMNGNRKRYEGLAGCIDYKKAAQIIKDGGYATSHTYVQSLCSIIERWNLTQYNAASGGNTTISGWYRVRKSWQNAASQKGAFHDLTYAKQCADKNPGYYVFDPAGKAVYPEPKSSVPYTVRVSIKDLNIRKGPGTNYGKTGYYTGKGVFTIVAESAGAGSAKGWGKLKSGAGWIALDFAARI